MELFRQTINTRSGIFVAQRNLNRLLALILCAIILPIGLFLGGFPELIVPFMAGLLVFFAMAVVFQNFQYPKEIELLITGKKIRFLSALGLKKEYREINWEEIVGIRKISGKIEAPGAPTLGLMNATGRIGNSLLKMKGRKLSSYAILAGNDAHVLLVDSIWEDEFVNALKKHGKLQDEPMTMYSFFNYRNSLARK